LWLTVHKRFLSRADLDEGRTIVKVISLRREFSSDVASALCADQSNLRLDATTKSDHYLLPRRTDMRGRTVGGNGSFGGALGAGGAGTGGGWCSNCPIVAARKSSAFVTVSPIFVSGNFISPI
jgi:hypothetical protein